MLAKVLKDNKIQVGVDLTFGESRLSWKSVQLLRQDMTLVYVSIGLSEPEY